MSNHLLSKLELLGSIDLHTVSFDSDLTAKQLLFTTHTSRSHCHILTKDRDAQMSRCNAMHRAAIVVIEVPLDTATGRGSLSKVDYSFIHFAPTFTEALKDAEKLLPVLLAKHTPQTTY